ncbi:MAG TPA: DUF1153 domain-containing protein, partial [Thermoleophilia bacterium]|nr:DUF1153 domain-containing protein [Thermoleophilia bacterium]
SAISSALASALSRLGVIVFAAFTIWYALAEKPNAWQEVVDMTDELPDEVQRWTAKRRSALVLSIIRGETSVQEAARKHGLTVAEVEDWREKFLLAAENALRTKPRDEDAQKDEQIKKLKQKVGELVLDIDIIKEAQKGRPFAPETSDE